MGRGLAHALVIGSVGTDAVAVNVPAALGRREAVTEVASEERRPRVVGVAAAAAVVARNTG